MSDIVAGFIILVVIAAFVFLAVVAAVNVIAFLISTIPGYLNPISLAVIWYLIFPLPE